MTAAVEEIRELLRRRRKVPYGAPDNFGISTSEQILSQFAAITGGVSVDGRHIECWAADRRHRSNEYHVGFVTERTREIESESNWGKAARHCVAVLD